MGKITVSSQEAAEYLVSRLDIKVTGSGNTLMFEDEEGGHEQCRKMVRAWELVEVEFIDWCLNADDGRVRDTSFYVADEEEKKSFKRQLFEDMKDSAKARAVIHAKDLFKADRPGSFNLAGVRIVTVLGESKKDSELALVNGSTNSIIPPSIITVPNFRNLNKTLYDEALRNMSWCNVKYDPTKPKRWEEDYLVVDEYIYDLDHYNLHVDPLWKAIPDTGEGLPEDILKILSHMVRHNAEQLNCLFDSTHFMLKDRNHVYLVLSGSPGIGKGLYGILLTALLGDSNVKDAPKGALKSNFNDLFSETRLVIHDEYPASTREEMASLKKNIENKQSIQKKFQDAQNLEKIWASQIITVNKGIRYAFEPNERKFSVLDLTNVPLLEIMSETEINAVTERINEDTEYLAKIGHFFLNRKPTFSKQKGFKGRRFWQMCVAGLTGFNRYLLSELRKEEGKQYVFNSLAKSYISKINGRELPSEEEVIAHLEMWRLAGRPIARISRVDNRLVLTSMITPQMFQDSDEAEAEVYEEGEDAIFVDDDFDML